MRCEKCGQVKDKFYMGVCLDCLLAVDEKVLYQGSIPSAAYCGTLHERYDDDL